MTLIGWFFTESAAVSRHSGSSPTSTTFLHFPPQFFPYVVFILVHSPFWFFAKPFSLCLFYFSQHPLLFHHSTFNPLYIFTSLFCLHPFLSTFPLSLFFYFTSLSLAHLLQLLLLNFLLLSISPSHLHHCETVPLHFCVLFTLITFPHIQDGPLLLWNSQVEASSTKACSAVSRGGGI